MIPFAVYESSAAEREWCGKGRSRLGAGDQGEDGHGQGGAVTLEIRKTWRWKTRFIVGAGPADGFGMWVTVVRKERTEGASRVPGVEPNLQWFLNGQCCFAVRGRGPRAGVGGKFYFGGKAPQPFCCKHAKPESRVYRWGCQMGRYVRGAGAWRKGPSLET